MLWMKRSIRRIHLPIALAISVMLTLPWTVVASGVDVAVVDVTAPTDAVTVVPGDTVAITINMSVTGAQAGTATFEVYRDWVLSGGVFTGSNPQTFQVEPQSGGTTTNFSTSGTVSIAAGQADGTFTLEVGAFDITNDNPTGAKLSAGRSSSYEVTVEAPIAGDTTPPVITYLLDPAAPDGANGWYTNDVTLTWTVEDDESDVTIDAGCENHTIDYDTTGVTLSCTASSEGGTSGPVEVTIKRDATDPDVAVTGVADDAIYTLGSVPAAGCDTTDDTSGVAVEASLSGYGDGVGSHTVSCAGAEDNAGNTGGATATYSVIYDFSGFLSPLAHKTSAKAGSAIPVKFSLDGDQGLNIFAAGFPKSTQIGCGGDPIEGAAETTTVTAGDSALSYDPVTDEYTYVWKSDKGWANSCRILEITLVDGEMYSIIVNFKK